MKPEIRLVITDIDGVWTDGGMYYETGNEWKKFNTSDSAGVLFLDQLAIPLAIITGEDTNIVKRRADKLGIKHLFMGVNDKAEVAASLCGQMGITLENVAYIGDDIGDIELLKKVGISAAPADAPAYLSEIVDYTMTKKGGEGVFREFVEMLIEQMNIDISELVSNFR